MFLIGRILFLLLLLLLLQLLLLEHQSLARTKQHVLRAITQEAEFYTRMHGVSAHTGFPRTLTTTSYLSALFSTLNPILSVTNLSRLECAETPCIRVGVLVE
jgi:hypothetical protein